jgi:hypothetical protein
MHAKGEEKLFVDAGRRAEDVLNDIAREISSSRG